MFKPVDQKQSFPKLEHEILEFWEKNKIFEKSLEARKGKEKYVFFDGPPFANGLPHYGHILANALKDAVTRYWSMKGYYVPRINGWDCHGLPVEYEVEKQLGLNGKKDIEEMGIAAFNEKCRESVFTYTKEWEALLKRIARWVDFENSYATLENEYMESIWWVFKQIWLKEMVYQGYKSMHVCPRCETPLSNFEVSQGYKDITDQSVIAKFKLVDEDTYILAWTTTPWTLPGNIGLCLGPKIKYVKVGVRYEDGSEEVYIVAKDLVESVFKDMNFNILEDVDPKKLEGKQYEPLFDFYKEHQGEGFKIVLDAFVSTEEGTGIVHMAPMFGEDDYRIAQNYDLPLIQHVAMNGTFNAEVKPWAGKFVKGQDQNIVKDLKKRGLVFKAENYRHSYPHCWRCDTPLLNYATRSWFIKVSDLKPRLIKNNKKIHWQPGHIKDGRFGKWLEGVRDWSISRNRYWGCPLPIWECEDGHNECIGSISELKERSGGKLPMRNGELDLHKPYIDEITFECKCGKQMSRIPEVLDCWFESGAMPYAQMHYPFVNKQELEDNFPADFIAEGVDQTRGWFYTLHVLASILFDEPAFKNVIVNGILLAADGEKLSKRKKNYPDPSELFESLGADSTRMFLYASTTPLGEDARFSESHVEEIMKQFTLTLWNTYSFFVTYASIDKWEPTEPKAHMLEPSHKLDQWILSELHQLIGTVTKEMDDYNLTRAVRPMIDFVDNLSNWYIRRSRRRFWKSENDADKFEAYETLHMVLVEFSKLLAPFMPFLSESMYKNLTGKESVHLADWPKVNPAYIRKDLNEEIKLVRQIVAMGHSVRDKANIKVRQPLSLVQIALPANVDSKVIEVQKDVICEELNVKEISFLKDAQEFITRVVTPNARVLGPKYGKEVQNIIQMAKAGEYELLENGVVKIGEYELESDEVAVGFEGKEGFDVASSGGMSVILDTVITDELKQEGYAREIVRFLQDLRKEANHQVDDRIYVYVEGAGPIDMAVKGFADYIMRETLAMEVQAKGDFEWDQEKIVDIDGVQVKLAVRK